MSDMTWVLSPENVNAIDAAIVRHGKGRYTVRSAEGGAA